MKTNKSYSKRLKVSKNGRIVARVPGQNHFNAKEVRQSQYKKRRAGTFSLTQRAKRRFLVGVGA